ncbi:MAG: endo-1,4-beta-xylanase [Saprospiraceae bacterium]|nr:endo-1,4-beta-xylanase [Saprospiraceae bacterium]MCB9323410.1 endo-1,4-beta-xylanase [Lewinellaceae bacterium]
MRYLITFIILGLLFSCRNEPIEPAAPKGLKDAFAAKFYMGTALNLDQIYEKDPVTDSIIRTHFNAIVAENCMKSVNIHPEKDRYFWEDADAFVAYGEKNDMFITGHTLAWHSQTPDWLFVDENGNDVDRDEMIQRLESHIAAVMGRYKGKVKGWDVVNEAINDDGTIRESKFYKIIGPDWIEIAFKAAAKADPDAELYYNDYNLSSPVKSKAVYEMVKSMQAKGIKVDGIGMQGHLNMDAPDLEDFENSLMLLSTLGKIMITELDVTVLPWPSERVSADVSLSAEYQEKMNPFPNGLPDSMSVALNDRFISIFKILLKHQDKITRVTTWGVNDAQTWRNYWPIAGRSDYPLLFNRDNSPKPAVDSLILMGNKTKEP